MALHPAPRIVDFKAASAGYVQGIDTRGVGLLAVEMGAGRLALDTKIDPAVGIDVLKKVGDRVEAGEPLGRLHLRADNPDWVRRAAALFSIGAEACAPLPLVYERIK